VAAYADAARLPSECQWYAYGDYVLDLISGRQRAEQIRIAAVGPYPHPDVVRQRLRVPPALPVTVASPPHELAYTVDALVALPDGRLWDVIRGELAHAEWPLKVAPLSPELSVRNLLRLRYMLQGYPELIVAEPLRAKVEADVNFLERSVEAFPEVALILLEYTPFSSWRIDRNPTDRSETGPT
jgi:hypothetical protein